MSRSRAVGLASIVSVIAIFAAALLASVPVASECGTRPDVHILRALAPFAIFVVAGAWIVWAGSPGQRLFVFLGAVLAMAGYVGSLSLSMPMVIETEIGCAKDSAR